MKKIPTFLLLCTSFLALSSCNQNSVDKSFKPKFDQSTKCSLMIRGHYENFDALVQEFPKFNSYYPNVELSYEYDKNHKKNMIEALNGDTPPDIFFTYSDTDFDSLQEYTVDLSKPGLDFDLSTIRSSLIYRNKDNEVPCILIYTTSFGMMVNEDLFEKHNLKIPTTYDELVKVCQDFIDKGVQFPILGHKSMVLYPLYFPHFCASILNNQTALDALNSMSEGAGEYMRSSLTLAKDFIDRGFVDKTECENIANDYNATILRFFEADVPMMLVKGSSFSGTEKREDPTYPDSTYASHPFKYSFVPVPSTDKGGYCYNTVELCFSINKKSQNVDMANEFIRFLLSSNGLGINRMSKVKRMMTPCKDLSYDSSYSAFNSLDESRMFTPSQLGLASTPDQQVRKAGTAVCFDGMSVDEAIANFGNFQ